MPRRDLLSPVQRTALLALPDDEGELIRRYPFSSRDMALVQQRRGDPNRFGFAVHLCYFRFPGQILGAGESPDARLTRLVARQLGIDPDVWSEYAQRDQTRREHLQLIIDA